MANYAFLYRFRGKIALTKGSDRNFREKHNRLQGLKGAELVYRVPEKIRFCRIYAFVKNPKKALTFSFSEDGKKDKTNQLQAKTLNAGANDYQYWDTVVYEGPAPEGHNLYLHIHFAGELQIARVEIFY